MNRTGRGRSAFSPGEGVEGLVEVHEAVVIRDVDGHDNVLNVRAHVVRQVPSAQGGVQLRNHVRQLACADVVRRVR
eukprot:5430902-Pyramimonas_sp.AAC.2